MILLDTNVVSEAMRPGANRRVVDWLNAQDLRTLHLSTISLAELGYGIAALPDGRRKNELKARLEETEDRVFGDRILAFDRTAAAEFSERMAAARKAGRGVGFADGQIAAIAAAKGMIVASRDTAPFEAMDVAFTDPWAA
ncbi:type II toxin-antitoxin system VapC family toxin [Oceaniradius stylonematis]|uniref:Ribonuclease VapC n=1 Tax=Oceaniradius stylonematis TaxID=2184161 RepID=A0A3A8AFQ4_9HYPH|nr:type II toxin-antitoxin system VapC family toxin [Oceaniradius stylonematis]RKF05474.1 type II toxin-antitoxin system VapC family toxin [Oceaniradius stylonematis]